MSWADKKNIYVIKIEFAKVSIREGNGVFGTIPVIQFCHTVYLSQSVVWGEKLFSAVNKTGC